MNKHLILFALGLVASLPVARAAKSVEPAWRNPAVNQINRETRRADFFAFESPALAAKGDKCASARYMSLERAWKFHFAKNYADRAKDFWRTDFDDSHWADFKLPGLFEINGYGDRIYRNAGYAWSTTFETNPPYIGETDNYTGSLRTTVELPAGWAGQQVVMHIGSATSNVSLWVNGKYVGYSEDSKVAAEFDITKFVHKGKNVLAMQIMRWCDGSYVEDQDFWRFTGIAREVYLYSRAKAHLADVRTNGDMVNGYKDGLLTVEADVAGAKGAKVVAELRDAAGKIVATQELRGGKATIEVKGAKPWTAETPYLYRAYVALYQGDKLVEVVPQNVGFRHIEIAGGNLLVNGRPVLIKGADRHELDPDGGYVVSVERMVQDIRIMKSLNINAVRTCHYPDDPRWYDLCDKYGIYLTAESNLESHGMGYGDKTLAKNPAWAQTHIERQQGNMQVLRNHPSIIVWSLGNEAGYGPNFEKAYDWVKALDPTRPCQFEQAGQKGKTDIFCPMYYGYGGCEAYAKGDNPRPLIQCEYAHAMGNSMGGFKEYWDLVRKYPKYQGGYIWDFVDQGLRDKSRTTGKEIFTYGGDYGRYPASDYNFNCNGIIAPDRRLNPHAYEVRYYYQNIWVRDKGIGEGKFEVKNENFFRPLDYVRLTATVCPLTTPASKGQAVAIDLPAIAPQAQQTLTSTALAEAIAKAKADYPESEIVVNFAFTAKAAEPLIDKGQTLAYEQLTVQKYNFPAFDAGRPAAKPEGIRTVETSSHYTLTAGGTSITIGRWTGLIDYIDIDGVPMLADRESIVPDFWRAPTDNDYGAGLQRKYALWKSPEMKLKDVSLADSKSGKVATAVFDMPRLKATLTMTYTLTAEGNIVVRQQLATAPEAKDMPGMFRYGISLQMPKQFGRIAYHGRGPIENYSDRQGSQKLIVADEAVADQYFPYIRPQESGNHTDVRTFTVYDSKTGRGLTFLAPEPMECSALNYLTEDLDDGPDKDKKHGRHSGDLTPRDITQVHISQRQLGLGCVNSWGAQTEPQYRLKYQDYDFSFMIRPYSKN